MLEGLWSFLGILWGQNGARNIKMRVSKSILAQVEVARGSQRVSLGRFWEDVHYMLVYLLYCGCGATDGPDAVQFLHRNDLGLPSHEGGSVSWDRMLRGDELAAFLGLKEDRAFSCVACGVDWASACGNFGYVMSLRSDGG